MSKIRRGQAAGGGEPEAVASRTQGTPAAPAPSSRQSELSGGFKLHPLRQDGPVVPASRTLLRRLGVGRPKEQIAPGFTSDGAIKMLTDHVSANRQQLGIVPARFADAEVIEQRLAKGKSLPLLPGYNAWVGVIDRTGRIQSNDEQLVQLFGQVNPRTLSAHDIPAEGLPIAVLAKTPWTADAHEAYLTQEIISHFMTEGTIPDRSDRVFEFKETVTWPFFHDLIAGKPPTLANRALAQGILALPGYQLVVPEISQHTRASLERDMATQRSRLLGVDLAELQYSARADWKDTFKVLTLSSTIGSGGDLLVRKIFPENAPANTAAYVLESGARIFLLVLTDTIDNLIGELETARGDLMASNLTPSLKTFTGSDSLREVAMSMLKGQGILNGDGGIYAKRAFTAGLKGASVGAGFAAATGFLLSTHGMDPAVQAPLGGALSVGSALSIPFDFRSAVKQVQSAVLELVDQGKIPMPEDGLADEAAKMQYAREIALQELVSRQSNSSSAKAFTLAPVINGAILASVMLGVPSEIAEMLFMGASPPMENISKLAETIWETKVERPHAMDHLRALVLETPGGFSEAGEETKLARAFARRWPRGVAGAITIGAKPPRPSSEISDAEQTADA